jgi:hypothetical protein
MKKVYFLILLLAQLGSNASTTDSIPNSSFEVWFISQWFDFPGSWWTNNSELLAPTVVRDTNAHMGQLAMRLTNSGSLQPLAQAGFAIAMHHTNVSLNTIPLLIPGDSAVVNVFLFEQGQKVDSGSHAIYTGIVPGYYQVIIPISQTHLTADSCLIEIIGGAQAQSDVVIDDISFDFQLGIESRTMRPLNVFPNPCKDRINIQSPYGRLPETIEVFSQTGVKMQLRLADNKDGSDVYDVSSLSSGSWIISIRQDKIIYSGIILKE